MLFLFFLEHVKNNKENFIGRWVGKSKSVRDHTIWTRVAKIQHTNRGYLCKNNPVLSDESKPKFLNPDRTRQI